MEFKWMCMYLVLFGQVVASIILSSKNKSFKHLPLKDNRLSMAKRTKIPGNNGFYLSCVEKGKMYPIVCQPVLKETEKRRNRSSKITRKSKHIGKKNRNSLSTELQEVQINLSWVNAVIKYLFTRIIHTPNEFIAPKIFSKLYQVSKSVRNLIPILSDLMREFGDNNNLKDNGNLPNDNENKESSEKSNDKKGDRSIVAEQYRHINEGFDENINSSDFQNIRSGSKLNGSLDTEPQNRVMDFTTIPIHKNDIKYIMNNLFSKVPQSYYPEDILKNNSLLQEIPRKGPILDNRRFDDKDIKLSKSSNSHAPDILNYNQILINNNDISIDNNSTKVSTNRNNSFKNDYSSDTINGNIKIDREYQNNNDNINISDNNLLPLFEKLPKKIINLTFFSPIPKNKTIYLDNPKLSFPQQKKGSLKLNTTLNNFKYLTKPINITRDRSGYILEDAPKIDISSLGSVSKNNLTTSIKNMPTLNNLTNMSQRNIEIGDQTKTDSLQQARDPKSQLHQQSPNLVLQPYQLQLKDKQLDHGNKQEVEDKKDDLHSLQQQNESNQQQSRNNNQKSISTFTTNDNETKQHFVGLNILEEIKAEIQNSTTIPNNTLHSGNTMVHSDDNPTNSDFSRNSKNSQPRIIKGRNFKLQLLLMVPFNETLKNTQSKQHGLLKLKLKEALSKIYTNDSSFESLKILNFAPSLNNENMTLADVELYFSERSTGHLNGLQHALNTGQLEDFQVGREIIDTELLNDQINEIKWCPFPCRNPFHCFPLCDTLCCGKGLDFKSGYRSTGQTGLLPMQKTFANSQLNQQQPLNYYVYNYILSDPQLMCAPICKELCVPSCPTQCCTKK